MSALHRGRPRHGDPRDPEPVQQVPLRECQRLRGHAQPRPQSPCQVQGGRRIRRSFVWVYQGRVSCGCNDAEWRRVALAGGA
eukprot:1245453-Rhodomonas_salina.2